MLGIMTRKSGNIAEIKMLLMVQQKKKYVRHHIIKHKLSYFNWVQRCQMYNLDSQVYIKVNNK